MATESISITAAIVAGLLSFFSPCVLPLVPVYLAYMTGTAATEVSGSGRIKSLLHALFFVLGFALVFVLLGAAAGLLGRLIYPAMPYVIRIGGLFLIVFGLHMAGVFSIPWLNMEKRFELKRTGKQSYWASTLVGVVFAAGWTPCVGPVLAGILLLAADSQTVLVGAGLLAAYALGLGLPFLVAAVLIDAFRPMMARIGRHLHTISIIGGVFLIIMGVLLLFGWFDAVVFWFNSLGSSY